MTLIFSAEEFDTEKWAKIKRSNGNYLISNLGRVKSIARGKPYLMTPYQNSARYGSSNRKTYFVKLKLADGRRSDVAVHHLVADAFLPTQPSNNHVLYHVNLSHADNRAINLAWITKQELGRKTGFRAGRTRGVVKICPQTKKIVDFYRSGHLAAKKHYCSYQTIYDACNGVTKRNCTGYLWRWNNGRY